MTESIAKEQILHTMQDIHERFDRMEIILERMIARTDSMLGHVDAAIALLEAKRNKDGGDGHDDNGL